MFDYIYNYLRGSYNMLKFLSKIAEKYAKSTNSACIWWSFFHQPTMPKSMIEKD